MTMNKWEIWLAKVVFEDDPGNFKYRPVVILETGIATLLSAKITGHDPRPNFFGEYQIIDWGKAGLKKQSTIRLSQIFRISPDYLVHKIGKLQPKDIYFVEKILEQI